MNILDPARSLLGALRRLRGRWYLKRAARAPTAALLGKARRDLGIQLSPNEMLLITHRIWEIPRARVLVFGTGKDSEYWYRVNSGGTTLFLEDNDLWIRQAAQVVPHLRIVKVTYDSRIAEWKNDLRSPLRFMEGIPLCASSEPWDVILVDAPEGWNDQSPGRVPSIFAASKLAHEGTSVFIHDCNRELERTACETFFPQEALRDSVERLRHYRRAHDLQA